METVLVVKIRENSGVTYMTMQEKVADVHLL